MATLTDEELMDEIVYRKLDHVRKVDAAKIYLAEQRARNTGHLEGYLMGEVATRARAKRDAERDAEKALLRRTAGYPTQSHGFPKSRDGWWARLLRRFVT